MGDKDDNLLAITDMNLTVVDPVRLDTDQWVMYVMYMTMVRKQLYIEERQETALRRRAKALGVSEAEVVRAALEAALATETKTPRKPLVAEDDPLEALLALAAEDAQRGHALPPGGYRREDLYAERETRLARRVGAARGKKG